MTSATEQEQYERRGSASDPRDLVYDPTVGSRHGPAFHAEMDKLRKRLAAVVAAAKAEKAHEQ